MVQCGRYIVVSLAVLASLFLLRPGFEEFHSQRKYLSSSSKSTSGRSATDLFQSVISLAQKRSSSLPLHLPTSSSAFPSLQLDDYILFTSIHKPSSKSSKSILGVWGIFFTYHARDDLLLLSFLSLVCYICSHIWPGFTYKVSKPSWRRPYCLVSSLLYSDSILGVVVNSTTLIDSGELLQRELGRWRFLIIVASVSLVANLNELAVRKYPRPVTMNPLSFAILTHVSLVHPGRMYNMFGLRLPGYGVVAVQMGMTVLSSYHVFLDRVPIFMSGIITGLSTFLFFHPEKAQSLLVLQGVSLLAERQTPQGLIPPLLGLNLFLGQYIAQNYE